MENIVQGIANVGITIFCIVAAILIVNWLDKNTFSGHKNFRKPNHDVEEKDND